MDLRAEIPGSSKNCASTSGLGGRDGPEFTALHKAAAEGDTTLLDRYGATNPVGFFAVATECCFECGKELRLRHAPLYAMLEDYYQHDPAVLDPRRSSRRSHCRWGTLRSRR